MKTGKRTRRGLAAAIAAAGLALAAPAVSADPDVFRGKAFAQSMCASCHAVEAGAKSSPVFVAPPFDQIRLGDRAGEALAAWLNARHPPIPAGVVQPKYAADISAYIASMAPAKGG